MKTNVQPGMLARVVSGPNMVTPELIGRIVFVERALEDLETLPLIGGGILCYKSDGVATWIVSAKEPLPTPRGGGLVFSSERALKDYLLRPLLDPNLAISDEEVKELYSPKEEKMSGFPMTAMEYLESLILGQKISSIPVQPSELNMLKMMMQAEEKASEKPV